MQHEALQYEWRGGGNKQQLGEKLLPGNAWMAIKIPLYLARCWQGWPIILNRMTIYRNGLPMPTVTMTSSERANEGEVGPSSHAPSF